MGPMTLARGLLSVGVVLTAGGRGLYGVFDDSLELARKMGL